MWTLRTAGGSPFGRKAAIGAAVTGFSERITVEPGNTNEPDSPLRRENPLGKIPTLVLEDGTAIYDSRVILEFFDAEAGGGVIIPAGKARIPALTLQALADGILDAAVLQVYEDRYRTPETRNASWLERQAGKVERALAKLEAEPPERAGSPPNVGGIALACALGYLDFRFEGKWRAGHPQLVAWLDDFAAKVPSFEATTPG
jgi:glutathione S-transferase